MPEEFTAEKAAQRLAALVDEVAGSDAAVRIVGEQGSAVLLGEDHWRSVQESLHLMSVPGVRESILKGMATPACDCDEEPGW